MEGGPHLIGNAFEVRLRRNEGENIGSFFGRDFHYLTLKAEVHNEHRLRIRIK